MALTNYYIFNYSKALFEQSYETPVKHGFNFSLEQITWIFYLIATMIEYIVYKLTLQIAKGYYIGRVYMLWADEWWVTK